MSQALWDVTGIDALAVMTALFGATVTQLARFQSVESTLDGQVCTVLRLCDLNFRIADAPTLSNHLPQQQCQAYLHQFDWLNRLQFPAEILPELSAIATVI